MDKLVSGIVLAALSALTFLAYKHHPAFRILGFGLIGAMSAALIGIEIYDVGQMHGFVSSLKFVDADRLREVQAASNEARLLTIPTFVVWVAACAYIAFLFWLPALLGEQKPPDEQDKPKRK